MASRDNSANSIRSLEYMMYKQFLRKYIGKGCWN
jgi:hypothetical protein